jgi:hypothetical protein
MPLSTSSFIVSAAVCQPLAARPPKKVLLGGLFVGVEGLRVELPRKGLDLRHVEHVLAALEAVADRQVFEIQRALRANVRECCHGSSLLCLRAFSNFQTRSRIVAMPCPPPMHCVASA